MNKVEEISKLNKLLEQGAITEGEFNSLKKKILSSPNEILKDSYTTNNIKEQKSSASKKYLFTIIIVTLCIASLFGISRLNISKKFIDDFANKFKDRVEHTDSDLAEDNGEKGKIVKRQYKGQYLRWNTGVVQLNIPEDKMWTYLYCEFSNESTIPKVKIFPIQRSGSWGREEYYSLDLNEEFISVKYSKEEYKPLTAKTHPAIQYTDGFNSSPTCTIYFYEESLY